MTDWPVVTKRRSFASKHIHTDAGCQHLEKAVATRPAFRHEIRGLPVCRKCAGLEGTSSGGDRSHYDALIEAAEEGP